MLSSVLEILSTLVAFDTTSRHSNLALIEWVEHYLAHFGIASRLTWSDDQKKANLFACVGPTDKPLLLLSGHTDVVPVDGQKWRTPPFSLHVTHQRAYGRGTSDMKGFIACLLAWVPALVSRAQKGELKQAIGIALSYDEEIGCLGVGRLINDLVAMGVVISGCIVGEPTAMQAIIAHKGIAHYRCRVLGRAAHSSLTPNGVNAIEYASSLIQYIRKLAEVESQAGQRNPVYDVPFSTLQTGMIGGGCAANIIPKECEFVFECRWLPGDSPQRFLSLIEEYAKKLMTEMHTVAPESTIVFEELVKCPPFEAVKNSVVLHYIRERKEGHYPGRGVAYTTEAGHFSAAGIPSVVFGPGSINQAHCPDEYIELAELDACVAWMNWLETRLCI